MADKVNQSELIALCCWLSGYPEIFYEKMTIEQLETEYTMLMKRKEEQI
ncbi:hypothetical protein [Psychrobacillus sp. FSL H8-0487]